MSVNTENKTKTIVIIMILLLCLLDLLLLLNKISPLVALHYNIYNEKMQFEFDNLYKFQSFSHKTNFIAATLKY